MSSYIIYNPTRRVMHWDPPQERCNTDQIKERVRLKSGTSEVTKFVTKPGVHWCRWCFPMQDDGGE